MKKVFILAGLLGVLVCPAGQIREIKTPPVAYANRGVVVDGDLGEWKKDAFARVVSLGTSEESIVHNVLSKSAFPYAETATYFSLQYDSENLYLATNWDDRSPAREGDGVTFSLVGEAQGKVAFAPVDGGKGVRVRVFGHGTWKDAAQATAKIRLRPDGSGWAMEAAVPWRELTGAPEVPSGDITAAWQFTWSGLDVAEIKKFSLPDLIAYVHTSMGVLTAEPQFRNHPHLPHPNQWGNVHFGKGADATDQRRETLVTDVTDMGCPRAKGVTVDGKLNDWKDGAWAAFAQLGDLLDNLYSGRVALAFDDDNLYVAGVLSHATGKPFNAMPAAVKQGFRGGDAMQMRLGDGKGFKVSFCASFDAQAGKPALTVDGTAHGFDSLLARGAELAFGAAENGYAFEMKVPWRALLLPGVAQPKAGEVWKATFQPWWQVGSNAFNYVTPLVFKSQEALRVTYTMPRDGSAAVGIFDKNGRILRQLVKGDFRAKGENVEAWDGKDQYGNFVEPGSYVVKAIVTDEIKAEYVFTLGNPGNPPWPTADGTGDWLSDEAPPQAMATDGENVYVAAPGNEKGFAVMKLDAKGQRQWGANEPFFPRVVSISYCDGKLYALFSGPEMTNNDWVFNGKNAIGRAVLIVYDAATGQKIDFSVKEPRKIITTWPYREDVTPLWEMIQKRNFAPGRYIGQPRYWAANMGETCNAIGVAATPERIVVSRIYDNKLEFYDPKTAVKTGELPLAEPAGLHALKDQSILAVSGKTVVRISRDNQVTPLVTKGLEAPVAVTMDKDGFIYVSDWAGAMQVKKFKVGGLLRFARNDAAELVATIGRTGGRAWLGDWEPDGMLMPHGLAVTDDGRLFVAEADMSPKRISVWNTKTGAFEKDWLGPTAYGGCTYFWYDPDEPNLIHHSASVYEIGWKPGAEKILRTEMRRMSMDEYFMPNPNNTVFTAPKIVTHAGKKFLFLVGQKHAVVLRVEGKKLVPCAAVGGLHRYTTDDGTGEQVWDSDIKRHMYRNTRPEVFRHHKGDNYTWVDRNGDGLIQPAEMKFKKTLTRGGVAQPGEQYEYHTDGGGSVDSTGAVYFAGFGRAEDVIYRLAPQTWSAHGPVFDIEDVKVFYSVDTTKMNLGGWVHNKGVYVDSKDRVYVPTNASSVPEHMRAKFKDTILVFDVDGRLLWTMARPPDMEKTSFGASNFVGEWQFKNIGNVVCSWHWWWNFRPYFVSEDGLYLGTALEETKLGPSALWSESCTYFLQKPDGTAYLVNSANQAFHFHRMHGFENAVRVAAPFTVSAADLARAREVAKIVRKAPLPKREISVRACAPGAARIDGDLADWKGAPFVSLDGGKGRRARLALGRMGDRLLLAADVDDPTPMRQVGSDYQCLFTTGDVVDLMLATDPAADPNRRAAAPGDKRLSITEFNGRMVAVLSEPKVAGFTGKAHQLMAARLDRIALLDNARIALTRRANGYALEAAIPLADLGLAADSSATLRGDLGVVFSDSIGGRELRLYHYNKKTEMVADLTTEATLQPAEWGNIHFPLGLNALKDGDLEGALQSDKRRGWMMDHAANGGAAKMDARVAFNGGKSLLLQMTEGVTFSDEALRDRDYEVFRRAANGGKGSAHVSMAQIIPVVGGTDYRARFRYRAEGLKNENRRPGADRGYVAARIYVSFHGADGRHLANRGIAGLDTDSNDWVEVSSANEFNVGGGLAAPPGATFAIVSVKFTCLAPNRKPKLWLDAFELTPVKAAAARRSSAD